MKRLLFAFAVLAAACSSETPTGSKQSVTRVAEPDDVKAAREASGRAETLIDQELMIALAQAKNFHHKARVYQSSGQMTDAIDSVRQILTLGFPVGASEADDVRNDARALLGKLLLSQNQLDEAQRVVEEGIAASQRESFFVANLHTVKGEILEERAKVTDATDKPKANELRRAAILAFEKSIQINETLQKQLMEER
jgi:hypothetical protein